MADHGDIKAHEATYGKVIGLLKWGLIVSVIVTAIVVWLISG